MTRRFRLPLLALALAAAATSAAAQRPQLDAAARVRHDRAAPVPPQLTDAQQTAYRAVFDDLAVGNWAGAAGRLDEAGDGPLHDVLRARLYTTPGSPVVELEPLLTLLARAPDLPQAAELARLARLRGAIEPPLYPEPQRLVGLGAQPRRARPRPERSGEPLAATLDALIQPLIRADQPGAAEAVLLERGVELSAEARTEFGQRVAWSYFTEGMDGEARRVADEARLGSGDWAVQAEWTAGLAAWRGGDCAAAAASFQTVARRTGDPELAAAGHYWASRAEMRCGRPERVQPLLRAATGGTETFYGLLAESALGLRAPPADGPEVLTAAQWATLARRPNVRAAVALIEVGQSEAAAATLRHQAQIGPAGEHVALTRLAARLNLPSLQTHLAHNGPRGVRIGRHDRYPTPDWRPAGGWRVDQALAYAHALQESNFRPEAVSGAGARGLMQVRPGTARDLVRWGLASGDPGRLNDPINNLGFGQAYLEYLSADAGTGGLLPRVIAAYNAGPTPIATWTAEGIGGGDPLLWIESLPYWETRGYVPIVLRNYWMYEAAAANASASRRALAQGLWPRFPGLAGAGAVRLTATGAVAAGN